MLSGKESACSAGDMVSVPGLGRSPRKENSNPFHYFLPGKSHGQKSLVGYSPWGHNKSDMAERHNNTNVGERLRFRLHQSVENGKEGTDTRDLTRKESLRHSKCLDLEKYSKVPGLDAWVNSVVFDTE